MVYFLKFKSETFKAFLSFKSLAENTTQNKVIYIRTDNGREYLSNEWKIYYIENGIRHEFTAPNTPQQNGLAERKN
jgi:transposase InsO family protein